MTRTRRLLLNLSSLVIGMSANGMSADAAIICQGKTERGIQVEMIYEPRTRTVRVRSEAADQPKFYRDVHDVWDGHMSGLVTAPLFALKYESHYGCIRNVVMITDVRAPRGLIDEAKFGLCRATENEAQGCGLQGGR